MFHEEGLYDFADLIARMVDAGAITNGSVGFRVLDGRPPTKEEIKARGLSPHSMIITSALLKEYSIVPVGADPNSIKVRGDEIRTALDGMVERGEADKSLANMLIDSLNLWEPMAHRSIVVPEMWRGSAGEYTSESDPVDGDSESPLDLTVELGVQVNGVEELRGVLEEHRAEQAVQVAAPEGVEAMGLGVVEADPALSCVVGCVADSWVSFGQLSTAAEVGALQRVTEKNAGSSRAHLDAERRQTVPRNPAPRPLEARAAPRSSSTLSKSPLQDLRAV